MLDIQSSYHKWCLLESLCHYSNLILYDIICLDLYSFCAAKPYLEAYQGA